MRCGGGQGRSAYPALSALLGGDDDRIGKILHVFYRSVREDLDRLEHFASVGQWHSVANLANRITIACRQIGEERAADAFASEAIMAIECARKDAKAGLVAFAQLFQRARRVLIVVLDRAVAFAASVDAEA